MTSHNPSYANSGLGRLLAIMAQLRDPNGGCPWDLEQTFATIAPYTIEESYEVADAIERGALGDLRDELGDLLFQVVFHAQMASEAGAFSFEDVAAAVADKMLRRHPHVFGSAEIETAEAQTQNWEALKAAERAAKGAASVLDDVPKALPALMRAEKLTKRAARIGFDWPTPDAVIEKLHEELDELQEARTEGDQAHVAEEFGDLLFVMANLGRKLGLDPEHALRAANAKFERRFRAVEAAMAASGAEAPYDLEAMEAAWSQAKAKERG